MGSRNDKKDNDMQIKPIDFYKKNGLKNIEIITYLVWNIKIKNIKSIFNYERKH